MLVGIVTMKAEPWELEQNWARMERLVRGAAERRAEVVIAPESVLDGYVFNADPTSTRERMFEVAQTVPDGPYLIRAGELSRELGIYLIFGFLEREGEDLFNACVMIDPQGRVIAHYRKITTAAEYGITPGRELKPFDTPLGRFGLLLCSDRATENCRTLAVQGAQVIFIPMDGSGGPDNTEKMRWQARDTGCWIVIANTWSAVIVSPSGETHLEKYETECVSVQFLYLRFDSVPLGPEDTRFAGRRPDLYGPLARTFGGKSYYDEQGRLTAFGEQRRQEARQEALEHERKRAEASGRSSSPVEISNAVSSAG